MIYFVNHRYKEKMIFPLIAIERNVSFLCDKSDNEKKVQTSDGVLCDLVDMNVKNIIDMEDEISMLYDIDAYEFLKRWRNVYKNLDSLSFCFLELKKV